MPDFWNTTDRNMLGETMEKPPHSRMPGKGGGRETERMEG